MSIRSAVGAIRRRMSPGRTAAFDPRAPFGVVPRADIDTYLRLHREACARTFPEVDEYLKRFDHQIDRAFLEELALHTQVVVKQSPLNFQHGRILHSLLRDYIERHQNIPHFTIFETGTARGYSAICMANVLCSAGRDGKIVTVDIIEHNRPHLWNCIDDHDGAKSRHELLAPWPAERDRVVFLTGTSQELLRTLGLGHIHFAFLDASHTEKDVMVEYDYVEKRQDIGDMIIFDDVTVGQFDGVVLAVNRIADKGLYSINAVESEDGRAYAIATRIE